ncbi:MAG TPA: hypothetical protein PKE30_20950, partial [Niabella sp.]|nr:hypothetical protein [Niabella sp.]
MNIIKSTKVMTKVALFATSIFFISCILLSMTLLAQDNRPVQTIRGIVIDYAWGKPLSAVSVRLL